MTDLIYHKLLRVCALTLGLVLLFVSGVISPITQQLSVNTGSYLATAIGINAAVLPTQTNTLAAQLEARNNELTQREIAVELKESAQESGDASTYILSILLFILLVLIVLNYALDYVRAKEKLAAKTT